MVKSGIDFFYFEILLAPSELLLTNFKIKKILDFTIIFNSRMLLSRPKILVHLFQEFQVVCKRSRTRKSAENKREKKRYLPKDRSNKEMKKDTIFCFPTKNCLHVITDNYEKTFFGPPFHSVKNYETIKKIFLACYLPNILHQK